MLLLGLTFAFYNVLKPFLIDILLAVILVLISAGLYNFLHTKLRLRAGLASFLIVFVFFLAIVGLFTFVAVILTGEAAEGYKELKRRWPDIAKRLTEVDIAAGLSRIPYAGPYLAEMEVSRLSQLVQKVFSDGTALIIALAQQSFASVGRALAHFVLVVFLTFFLLKQGKQLWVSMKALMPLNDADTDELARDIVDMTQATMISTLVIGLIEGIYGGLIFLIFGLPSPVMWAVFITILSMIPLIGTNLIIVPAGVIALLGGRYAAGAIIVLLGLVGVAVTQNIIKPKLLAGRTGLHPALVLLATIGAMAWLGIIGFIVGPVLASLFIAIWRQYGRRYQRELATKNE